MPKPIAAFACETCQKIHVNEDDAAMCEKRHGDAVVTEILYEPGKYYPESVKVTITHASGETKTISYY